MNQPAPPSALVVPDDKAALEDYEQDFALWIETQTALLRARKFDQLDLENVIEEFNGMGRSERRELASRLEVLLMHLLKCRYQPEEKSRSWLGTIIEQRSSILRQLKQSPSLRRHVEAYASEAYSTAVARAAMQIGLEKSDFPATNPFTPEQLRDPEFFS